MPDARRAAATGPECDIDAPGGADHTYSLNRFGFRPPTATPSNPLLQETPPQGRIDQT
tara:strand:- start:1725 stop:1898 length:174 start_codon:yes stop_codon:yes gene_type:complete